MYLIQYTGASGKMTFSMIKVANSTGQELHIVRSQLSNLVKSDQEIGTRNENTVSVEFSGQAYHIRSLGDFSHEELDHIKKYLCDKMEVQEKRQLERLYLVHAALCSESPTSPFDQENSDSESDTMTDNEEDGEKPDLRTMTKQYFSNKGLDRAYFNSVGIPVWPLTENVTSQQTRSVANNVQSLVAFVWDYKFTGKSVARIFHGIASPRFSHLWGYVNDRFWRRHLDISFDNLCKIINEKLSQIYGQ